MEYGIPQATRDKHTGRVRQMKMWAVSAADELFLTRLYEALDTATLKVLTIEDDKGAFFYYCDRPSGLTDSEES